MELLPTLEEAINGPCTMKGATIVRGLRSLRSLLDRVTNHPVTAPSLIQPARRENEKKSNLVTGKDSQLPGAYAVDSGFLAQSREHLPLLK